MRAGTLKQHGTGNIMEMVCRADLYDLDTNLVHSHPELAFRFSYRQGESLVKVEVRLRTKRGFSSNTEDL